ncbi:MAG: YigZ family protein [Aquirufa antheringensis]|nr:YigZ family protein [Aquirufa antheringensis]
MSLIPDSYLTIAKPAEGLYKDKGSKFISWAYPVKDLEEIKSHLASLREAHPKARHICYAYRLGFTPEEARSNDDGEPSGSAGKPILNTILSQNLHYVLVAVVRYFGGTLLGVPGLIQAYKEGAVDALDQAEIYEKEPMETLEIHFTYSQMNEVMKVIKKYPIQIVDQEVNIDYWYNLTFPQRVSKDIRMAFDKRLDGNGIM